MTQLHSRTLSKQQTHQYHQDGFFVARGLLGHDEVVRIRDTFMEQAAQGPVVGLNEVGRITDHHDPLYLYPRMMHPHRYPDKPVGQLAMTYLLEPRIGAILRDLLDDEPIAAQTMFYFKPPGARGQDLHQDNFFLRVTPGSCMAAWIAVDDADSENGGMVVVPGSHRLDIVCPEQADSSQSFTKEHVEPPAGMRQEPVDLKAGDVLFFNGSVIHGSYPNTSEDRFRRAFISHYVPRSCHEVANGYHPLYDFNGNVVSKEVSSGGGVCGEVQAVAKEPH
ncbi:MAG: phytanoyl-CoA dioxygenase family protein [Deinococcota bacterium]|jgi:ectoine hydroxylase-related dioxygenase (phytanoyl-CoA dioxygenase family)|nr:phytanoyl-CoA dioxygenase family protein [Deinococcota bacterium]